MFKKTLLTFAILLITIGYSEYAYAQSSITFQVNLKPQLEDSVFVPGRDIAKITGNTYPLTGKGVILKDTSPKDSIYTIEVKFPGSATGKEISYNFVLNVGDKVINESMPRSIRLRQGDFTLDALYFDSFAW